jgi:hypothetical protein
MRLVLRDVEFANAKGEVDRVEILERGRQIRKMEGEKNNGKNAGQLEACGCGSARLKHSGCRRSDQRSLDAGSHHGPAWR